MEKHFTSTVYIISKIGGVIKVLLHKHKKLNMWLGIGGHIEKDENPIEASIREVKEETGLDVKIINTEGKLFESKLVRQLITPMAILEEIVPGDMNQKSHKHIDFIFFATCDNPNNIKMEKFGWFSRGELGSLELEEDVRFLAKKVLEFVFKI